MAERQETSVMVSIQEILQDAQNREVEEKAEAERRAREQEQRRLEEIRLKQEAEAARVRAEEEERQRRDFEEQKRQAELKALSEAALQKVKIEAESQARLAEIESRQEHERQLHALSQDKHKRRLTLIAAALGVVFFVGAIGAGIAISNISAAKARAEAIARDLASQKEQVEQQQSALRMKLDQATDPATIEALKLQLQNSQQQLQKLNNQLRDNPRGGGGVPATRPAAPPKPGGGPARPCNCTPGDPLCSCL
jgi:colicin import membrane protein